MPTHAFGKTKAVLVKDITKITLSLDPLQFLLEIDFLNYLKNFMT